MVFHYAVQRAGETRQTCIAVRWRFGLWPNVDIQLGLTPERDLGAVIEGSSTLPAAVTKYPEGGFDILAGRSGSGSLASLPTQKLSDMRNDLIALARSYDLVVVDLGAGVDRSVRQMAGPASVTYVVVTDEPTSSLIDGYAFTSADAGRQALRPTCISWSTWRESPMKG